MLEWVIKWLQNNYLLVVIFRWEKSHVLPNCRVCDIENLKLTGHCMTTALPVQVQSQFMQTSVSQCPLPFQDFPVSSSQSLLMCLDAWIQLFKIICGLQWYMGWHWSIQVFVFSSVVASVGTSIIRATIFTWYFMWRNESISWNAFKLTG